MTARLLSFVVWAVVAASTVFWGNRFVAQPTPVPAQAASIGPGTAPAGPLVRLFGAPPVVVAEAPPPVVADARFKLLGVAAPRPGEHRGWALIAVDERPARAFAMGARVDDTLVVQSIGHRQVDLGPRGGAASVSLTLPPVAEAARGAPPAAAPMVPAPNAGAISGRFRPPGGMQPPTPGVVASPGAQMPFAAGLNGASPPAGPQLQNGQPVDQGTAPPAFR